MGRAICPSCGHDVDWLNVVDTATVLGVGKARVQQLRKAGRFPGAAKVHVRSGQPVTWRIPIVAIEAYLRSKEAT